MKMRLCALIYWGMLAAGFSAPALADGPEAWRETENSFSEQPVVLNQRYTGVKPGQGNNLPRVAELKGKSGTWVTWPGFMPLENGGSRLFIQATESLAYTMREKGLVITLSFKNAKVHLSNNRNPLVTHYFNTPLKRAYLKKHKKQTDLVIELKVSATPSISQTTDSDGYQYMFVDFPPGVYPIIENGPSRSSFVGGGPYREEEPSAESPDDSALIVEEMNP